MTEQPLALEILQYLQEDHAWTLSEASLTKEIGQVWGWYLEYFKRVIELESVKDKPRTRRSSDGWMDGDDSNFVSDFSFRRTTVKRTKNFVSTSPADGERSRSYTMSVSVPVPAGWFCRGIIFRTPGGEKQTVDNIQLHFVITLYPKVSQNKPPSPSGGFEVDKNRRDMATVMINLNLGVKETGKLALQDTQRIMPSIKGIIAHELQHLWEFLLDPSSEYHQHVVQGNKKFSSAPEKRAGIDELLRYYEDPSEVSSRVLEISRIAKERRVSSTIAFQSMFKEIVRWLTDKAGESANTPEFKTRIAQLLKTHADAFNKRFPRFPITAQSAG